MTAPSMRPLPADLEAQVRRHCEAAYPNEACGALFGHGDGHASPWAVTEISPAPNEHGDDQTRRYLIPPDFQMKAERHALATDQEVLGYYHSHPDHPAQPSEYDRVHAWEGYLYLICAVQKGHSADLNAFALDEQGGTFLTVEPRLEHGTAS
ncbi:M67 family metallopeptidase [Geothrix sp. PMB-07]|uniref:M67 family metallopeptidase n=1 Tax=Geothrix sp. PMB-07 TaxID=3068640 RepID=UPI002740F6C0|nr:M67 family metallopeptidase [Geothrix sp. PMB-07]WLT33484.1 M67 family metallopeptidase [Geothrix sp. PMB-07]